MTVRLVPVSSPGHNGIPPLLSVYTHTQANLLSHLRIIQIHRPFVIFQVSSHRCVTCALAVQVIADKRPPPVAQHLQRIRIPVVLKPLSRKIYRRNHLLLKHTLYKPLKPVVCCLGLILYLLLLLVKKGIDGGKLIHLRTGHLLHGDEHIPILHTHRIEPP